jgi:hypothetical protein
VNYRGVELFSHSANKADYISMIMMLAFQPKAIITRISHIDCEINDEPVIAVSLAEGFRSHADAMTVVEHLAGAGEVLGHGAIVPIACGVAYEDLVIPPCEGESNGYFIAANWHHAGTAQ